MSFFQTLRAYVVCVLLFVCRIVIVIYRCYEYAGRDRDLPGW